MLNRQGMKNIIDMVCVWGIVPRTHTLKCDPIGFGNLIRHGSCHRWLTTALLIFLYIFDSLSKSPCHYCLHRFLCVRIFLLLFII